MSFEESESLLVDSNASDIGIWSSPSPRQVLRVALNLKYLIDQVIPIQLDLELITNPYSDILTTKVVNLAIEAAGGKGEGKVGTTSRRYRAVLIYCLLINAKWYRALSLSELHDAELHLSRMTAAAQLAKIIIEQEEDEHYLFIEMLCRRYVINVNDKDSDPFSALELAVDLHSTIVIGSSGYQKCIKWLWRGWIVQSDQDATKYEIYKNISKPGYWNHYDPDRIKTPAYQNLLQIFVSVIYLMLYSIVINSLDYDVNLGKAEILFYLFTLSFVADEIVKLYHVGYNYIGFWNAFNDTMYAIITSSFIIRMIAFSKNFDSPSRASYNEVAFRVLACAAPLMWSRLLLFLDSERFVGALLVVLKVLFKESMLFFFLLIVIIIGFLQAFLGLDSADGKRDITMLLLRVMFTTIIGEGDIDSISNFTSPYGEILYYFYSFSVTVILLNILVALYNTAYENIIENANDEYLALLAQKTLRYIRAPDEDVFVPPLNLLELCLLVIPFSWWLKHRTYQKLATKLMVLIYSPLLIYVAVKESKDAKRVRYNRMHGFGDDSNEEDQEFDLEDGFDSDDETGNSRMSRGLRSQQLAENEDPEFSVDKATWKGRIQKIAPQLEAANEVGIKWDQYILFKEVAELKSLVKDVLEENKKLRKELSKQ
ncbi:Yvc1 protein [Saccharomycopsis crataegensis]|uniref:Yvc1 protein n=1 Tax=Saccharomycopsis crataegensis TaxID=43959 RepID=A0AAV5QVM6_9ASCO|nr:Yvc1 protein [Saccharomycopsis crataegensis]